MRERNSFFAVLARLVSARDDAICACCTSSVLRVASSETDIELSERDRSFRSATPSSGRRVVRSPRPSRRALAARRWIGSITDWRIRRPKKSTVRIAPAKPRMPRMSARLTLLVMSADRPVAAVFSLDAAVPSVAASVLRPVSGLAP